MYILVDTNTGKIIIQCKTLGELVRVTFQLGERNWQAPSGLNKGKGYKVYESENLTAFQEGNDE